MPDWQSGSNGELRIIPYLYMRLIQEPRSMSQDLVDLVEILQLPRDRSETLKPRGVTALNKELSLLQVYKVAALVPARCLESHQDGSANLFSPIYRNTTAGSVVRDAWRYSLG